MRLIKIKLAGFKSFVDPTTFYLPSQLIGIVGPNGCGKSNIIDAVRWVMGESSARTLRGEAMADVIFNGSATRKPVGQAVIELIFDNSERKLAGPWARYDEISVKRVLDRSGQSQYHLNGTRCRRRDITDLFLGTGLGPRSYAIIEQGIISRVIESKPEEMRVFLEEAAGISKYKERRRETATRIRHTRENLERLSDVREELEKRLQHLQRQARSAERYKEQRSEERRLKAELLAIRWRALDQESAAQEQLIAKQETAVEALLAKQRSVEADIERSRQRQTQLSDELNQVQQRYYELGSEITRFEQQLTHQRELRRRQVEEVERTQQNLQQLQEQVQLDNVELERLTQTHANSEPDLRATRIAQQTTAEQLQELEHAHQDWQSTWDEFSHQASEYKRIAEVERTRIEQLERQSLQQQRQLERLRLEQQNIDEAGLQAQLEAMRIQLNEVAIQVTEQQEILADLDAQLSGTSARQREFSQMDETIRGRLQAARGRLASLETLQEAALGDHNEALITWLRKHHLHDAPQLVAKLKIAPGWEQAVETVLGMRLQARCVENLDILVQHELPQANVSLFELQERRSDVEGSTLNLIDKVAAPQSLASLLAGVKVANDLETALRQRYSLADGESLVTAQGVWLGRDWLYSGRADADDNGVLLRERDIRSLEAEVVEDTARLEQNAEAMADIQQQLSKLEKQRAEVQEVLAQNQREQLQREAQENPLQARLLQVQARRSAIESEVQELSILLAEGNEEIAEARLHLEAALQAMEQSTAERETLLARRDRLRNELVSAREQVETARQHLQQQTLAQESLLNQITATRQALQRLMQQQLQQSERLEQLQVDLAADDDPAIQDDLDVLLATRLTVEDERNAARRTLAAQDADLRDLEQARNRCAHALQEQRQGMERERLALGEMRVRRQTLVEQSTELKADVKTLADTLPAYAVETEWQAQLDAIAKRIERLGPINLAAIDEFADLSERKRYLDDQNDDLIAALTTLEDAMAKIDRETRSRFKATYDQVNNGIQALFPRLFGGGEAFLELTGSDMLDAGVTIMAKPPGKRIGNIHLLSGGEKALTAVALVFAIFQLNPAPFCMLDEVDAPLDDANIGRFGELVQEMSERVQFIFITHNKGTMEIAHHLAGVTMQEPGVSRVVAVDVDEAVRLTAV